VAIAAGLTILLALTSCLRNEAVAPFPVATGTHAHGSLPLRYDELAWVLAVARDRDGVPRLGLPEARLRLSRALGDLAAGDPYADPARFPTDEDALAWLVNAHVAWVVALHNAPELTADGVEALRSVPFPLAGGRWTLARLEREVLTRAPSEPRLALLLNPGFAGGPPLPETALEGHTLSWQLAEHAASCGRSASFWSFDPVRREIRISAFTTYMPGLPAPLPQRARRLLDLVPPSPELRVAMVAGCGEALQRCSVGLLPLDSRRWGHAS
jgi:hypothetical protein